VSSYLPGSKEFARAKNETLGSLIANTASLQEESKFVRSILKILIVVFVTFAQTTIHAQSVIPFQQPLINNPGGPIQQTGATLDERLQAIMNRPEFRHAIFGIEFYSLDANKAINTLNANKLFTPGSTTKLLTEETALELLGADYRFHTRVYRTGLISGEGKLDGDLVLVASGDPNPSGRIKPDTIPMPATRTRERFPASLFLSSANSRSRL